MQERIIRNDIYGITIQNLNELGMLNQQTAMYIMKNGADGKLYNAKIEWVEVEANTTPIEPAILERSRHVDGSSLKDAIVKAVEDSKLIKKQSPLDGELKATKQHLEDMRKLVFEEQVVTHITKEV